MRLQHIISDYHISYQTITYHINTMMGVFRWGSAAREPTGGPGPGISTVVGIVRAPCTCRTAGVYMYIYICVCMYVCIYTYIHICIHIYVHLSLYTHIYIYIHTHIRVCMYDSLEPDRQRSIRNLCDVVFNNNNDNRNDNNNGNNNNMNYDTNDNTNNKITAFFC